jgi:hypothetical protein
MRPAKRSRLSHQCRVEEWFVKAEFLSCVGGEIMQVQGEDVLDFGACS